MNEKWLKEDGRKEWVRKMKQGYHEIKEHGKREFPFNIYPCSIPVDFTHVALHWHEEMEIIAVKKGNGRITVDTVSYPVSEGDILAVFPGQLHAISCGSGERMEYENIIFRISMLMGDNGDGCTVHFLSPLQEGQAKKPVLIQKGQTDYEVFGNVIRELDKFSQQQGNGYQLAVKGQLFLFLYYAYGRGILFAEKKPGHAREKIKGILDYIREHFGEEITIKQAAELCFYSESHFMKYFKQYAGMPFIQYLNDYRLTMTGEFLQNTEESVTQIALKCGFENLSYFNRLFRRKFGVTPGQYRGEKEQPGSWEQPERQESVRFCCRGIRNVLH